MNEYESIEKKMYQIRIAVFSIRAICDPIHALCSTHLAYSTTLLLLATLSVYGLFEYLVSSSSHPYSTNAYFGPITCLPLLL